VQDREQLRKGREKQMCCIIAKRFSFCLSAEHSPEVTESVLPTFSAGEVRCDPPNNKLDKFSGTLSYLGNTYLLNHERLLLRGCVIRNTDWCYGLVVYTGTLPPRHSQTQPVSACSPPSCG
jgi:hypothetical protein